MLDLYNAVRGDIRTGDILLFSGSGLISQIIKLAGGSEWSHVGLACWIGEDLFIWESTTLSKVPDFISGKPHKGVQLVDLSTRLATYDGKAAWRAIAAPQRESVRRAVLRGTRREFRGRPYEESTFELIRAQLDTFKGLEQQPDASSLFCSEAAAYAHQALGWLGDISPNEITPADYAGDGDPLPWAAGIAIAEAVPIKAGD